MTTATILESKETVSLIASDKVEGTAVYGTDDKKIGKLERVMIDKISGKVAYAVLSFGGFLGMGEDYYPMPWSTLKYNTSLGGYRVALTKDQLAKAPKYSKSTTEVERAPLERTGTMTAGFTTTTRPSRTGLCRSF